ncbi:MAG: hypothetical protein ABR595_07020 [Psychroflexus sp.]
MKIKLILLIMLFSLSVIQAQDKKTENDTLLIWSENRSIKWNDFLSKNKVKGYIHDDGLATISLSLAFFPKELKCKDINSIKIIALMNKKRSWVGVEIKNGIKHEQLHFDIAELYARKMRRKLNYILSEDNKCDLQAIANMYKSLENEFWEFQFLYDNEVRIEGKEKINQQKWNIKIDSLLTVYKDYKQDIYLEDIELNN